MNGLLGSQSQAPQSGGLLGGGMPMQNQSVGMPPEMMKIVEQIKMMSQDEKSQAIQKMAEQIQQMPKSDQEKQQAIQQLIAAVQ